MSDNNEKWKLWLVQPINSPNYCEIHKGLPGVYLRKVFFKLCEIKSFCGGILVHDVLVSGSNPSPATVADAEEIKDVIFKYLRGKNYTFAVLADKIYTAETEATHFKASTLFDKEGTLSPVRKNLNSGNNVQMCIVDLSKYDQVK